MATYKDIARETGLALSTISKYFNGANLRKKNRIAIEEAIKKYDYRRNDFARALKSRRSNSIGLLIPELEGIFDARVSSGIENILRDNGYSTLICDCGKNINHERDALQFMLDRMVDGIITIPTNPSGDHLVLANEHQVPVITVDHVTTDFKTDCVIVNNKFAGEIAVSKFVEAGHEKIAIISETEGLYTMDLRVEGYKQALESRGIKLNPEYVIRIPVNVGDAYKAMAALLSLPDPPTAVFATNHNITIGAVIAANELGKKIGDDISLIGFDDFSLSQITTPRLSVIIQPIDEIAKYTAELMLERIVAPDAIGYKTVELPLEYVEGGSIKHMR